MWWKLDDHANHFCDACKRRLSLGGVVFAISAKQISLSADSPGTPASSKRLD